MLEKNNSENNLLENIKIINRVLSHIVLEDLEKIQHKETENDYYENIYNAKDCIEEAIRYLNQFLIDSKNEGSEN